MIHHKIKPNIYTAMKYLFLISEIPHVKISKLHLTF